jgi:hypothetical protein
MKYTRTSMNEMLKESVMAMAMRVPRKQIPAEEASASFFK